MTATASTLVGCPIIDTDAHVTEPPELWTSRMGSEFADLVPRVDHDPDTDDMRWYIGTKKLTPVAKFATAGWKEFPPSYPTRLEEAHPGAWDPAERLNWMDANGIQAQVLYPNLVAFYATTMLEMGRPDLVLAVVKAYNDFITEFASQDPSRLLPITMVPFWDLDAATDEIRRCAKRGHKGILFAGSFDKVGLPSTGSGHWDPIFAVAQDHQLSVNFHIGFIELDEDDLKARIEVSGAEHTRITSVAFQSNARAIADVITSGLCHRFPEVNFVSVESGVGWLPYLMESLDWHWKNYGGHNEHPEMELPSFYFRRQIYGSFWFEQESFRRVVDLLPDNVMFETDFPHPTSLSPGPASYAESPLVSVTKSLEGVPEHIQRKVLYENAARLYHLD